MNFLSLRTDETAQREIRDYAFEVEKFFGEKMPVTFDAWVENEKVAP
jgi:thymidylate synthase ThyX